MITMVVITLALAALVMVIYNIVRKKGDQYNQIVLNHQDYESRTLPYKRGSIRDRNGTYLATSEKVYNLILDPKQMLPDDGSEQDYQYLDATISALNECFGYDKDELKKLINDKKDSYYVIYKKQLSADQKEAFENLENEKNAEYKKLPRSQGGAKRVGGVWFEEDYKRVYPYNQVASNVVGFALKDGSGGSGGIEQYYNSTLTGNSGREYGYLNESNPERVVKSPQNGDDLISTIDINIQRICEKYINEWQSEVGSKVAAVVVMDPNTGEVLAMATNSEYNLNDPYNLEPYYTEAQIAAMDDKAKTDALSQMWRNYCVSDTYEPGSPQKVFTVAGALEEAAVKPDSTYFCKGYLDVAGQIIHCDDRSGHGNLTLTQGLVKSCNVVMMTVAGTEGKDKFCAYQKLFGFGSKTGIDLPAEADTSGLVYKPDDMGPVDLATNSFGQNYNCTMIQMSAAYCSLINGGSYYEPHVIKQILNDQGAVVKKVEPKLVRETVSEGTSNFIKNALYLTVSGDGGTGSAAAIPGYKIAGKTGTAEKQPRNAKNYLVSFAGFAPAYDPQVFCYVVLDTPNLPPGPEQAHSKFAATIFQKIMTEVLPYMNIFPDTGDDSGDTAGEQEGIISRGSGQPSGGALQPSGGASSQPSGGASQSSGGASQPSGGTSQPSGGASQPSGTSRPSGASQPSKAAAQSSAASKPAGSGSNKKPAEEESRGQAAASRAETGGADEVIPPENLYPDRMPGQSGADTATEAQSTAAPSPAPPISPA